MNFALQALVVFFLVLPGVILRSAYNGKISKKIENYPPFSREAVKIVIISAILHFNWVFIANHIGIRYGFEIDLQTVLFLLGGNYSNNQIYERTIHSITNNDSKIILYFSSLYMGALFFGYISNWSIRKYRLDRKIDFFKFNNEWHYLLSGEILQIPGTLKHPHRSETEDVDLVVVSAAVEVGNITYLYVGIVVDWDLDNSGNLNKLILFETYRRKIDADRKDGEERKPIGKDERYYKLEGDYFSLDCKNAKNINVDYLFIKQPTSTISSQPTPTV